MVVAGIYTPTNVDVIHKIDVDVVNRDDIPEPLHLVQYDQKIQVVEVSLWNGGEAYTVPTGAVVNVRYLKPDHTFVYNPALGVNNSRSVVYFQVSQEMTTAAGRGSFIIEIMASENKVLGTATAEVIIDKNPVQNDGIESKSEFKTLLNYVTEAEASKNAAKVSEDNAASSAAAASTSARNAKVSEDNAASSAAAASTSARNAKTSETNAANSATASSDSADKAKISETNAKTSETAAKDSETKAKTSETNAKTSETAAKTSELKAKTSEDNAKTSETNAANSATASSNSATASAKSAQNAKTSETNAASSASIADDSARDALSSEQNAKTSETNAGVSAAEALMSKNAAAASANQAYVSETNAASSAQEAKDIKANMDETLDAAIDAIDYAGSVIEQMKDITVDAKEAAETSAQNADSSATNAANSASAAETSAQNNEYYAKLSESYAVGTGGSRENEAIDNSKYYYEQTKDISEGLKGTLKPKGTIPFADLPPLSEVEDGWSYNISDKFTTTDEFKEGAGHTVPAGANIYKTSDGLWDVLAGTPVSSVNGQTGDVLITPDSIGAFPETRLLHENDDLNSFCDMDHVGIWYKPGTITLLNWPDDCVKSMGMTLFVLRGGGTTWTQILYVNTTSSKRADRIYIRVIIGSTACQWIRQVNRVKGDRETEYRGGDVNITPSNIGAVPWYNNAVIGADDNWNNFIDPGSYKVQGATMDSNHSAPEGLYNHGTMIVSISENPDTQNEHRTVQIYIPISYSSSNTSRFSVAVRTFNDNSWSIWLKLTNSKFVEDNFLKLIGGNLIGSVFLKGTGKGLYALNSDGNIGLGLVSDANNVRGLFDKSMGWWCLFLDYLNNLRLNAPNNISLEAPNTTLQNTGVMVLGGNPGVYEWVVAAQITVNGTYLNHTLKIEIGGRGRAATAELFVMFESTDNTDPGLAGFWYRGASDASSWIRIKKTAAHTWQIIALKNETYGDIFVASVNSQYQLINSSAVSITYPGTGVPATSVDSTWTAPEISGAVKRADYLKNRGLESIEAGTLSYRCIRSATSWPTYEIRMKEGSNKYLSLRFDLDSSGNVGASFTIMDLINEVTYSQNGSLVMANALTNVIYTIYKRLRISEYLPTGKITEGLNLETNSITVDVTRKLSICPESNGMVLIGNQNYGSMKDAKNFTDYDVAKPNILLSHGTNKDDWVGMGVNQYKELVIRAGGSASEQVVYSFGRHVSGADSYGLKIANEEDKYFRISPWGNYGCRISCFDLYVMSFSDTYRAVMASAFTVSSSMRYKENIRDLTLEDVREIVRKLRPVIFDYKNHEQGLNCYGLIAEEVEPVYPFAVSYDADGKPNAIDYSKLTTPLLKMVQIHDDELTEVKEELTKANEKITELEQKNQELEKRLAKLEALLLK